jgi:hypothetical protein
MKRKGFVHRRACSIIAPVYAFSLCFRTDLLSSLPPREACVATAAEPGSQCLTLGKPDMMATWVVAVMCGLMAIRADLVRPD